MAAPMYSIPGATAPPPAAPADQPARAAAQSVADVRIAEPDIRASRVFELAAAQKST
ncbi:MAG: hypothetical protein ACLP2F_03765 [Steroidobacteraceae bacterium]